MKKAASFFRSGLSLYARAAPKVLSSLAFRLIRSPAKQQEVPRVHGGRS
jgi:hypothetical protein